MATDENGAPPLLRVSGLQRRYGEVDVLGGLDLGVDRGTAVALVGPNGSGKSTALRCITGIEPASGGTVELEGAPLDERSPRTRAQVAAFLDDLDFFPDLSVVEHLDLLARAHQVPDAEPVVDAVLDEVGLVPQSDQLPGTLSTGQRTRLALAMVLVRPCRLLVLDEPEQRLDAEGIAWLADRLLRVKAGGVGILLASHDSGLVERVADRVVDMGHRE